jgi:hypothetical protein
MITLKIDVTKIDKSRLFVGKKGTYLDCVLIETPNSEYGDYMVVEETSKEEREAGKKGTILGNGKILTKGTGNHELDAAEKEARAEEEGSDDLPF